MLMLLAALTPHAVRRGRVERNQSRKVGVMESTIITPAVGCRLSVRLAINFNCIQEKWLQLFSH